MSWYPEPIPIPPPKPEPAPKPSALAAALLTPDSMPFRVTAQYGYTIARAEPTSRDPQGRMLATAGTDIYGHYVTWGGSHFFYPPDPGQVSSLLLTVAGERI